MKKMIIICMLISMNLFAYADMDKHTNDQQDNMKPIVISKGERTFTVTLPANASTGYQWVLKGDYDTNLIKAKSYEYNAPKTGQEGQKIVGAPGEVEFKFEVKDKFKDIPQILELHFAYIRFWDVKDSPSYKTVYIISAPQ